jgi:predicted DNA-binding ArsR family transcriptional regulator
VFSEIFLSARLYPKSFNQLSQGKKMHFSLAYTKNPDQVILKSFDGDGPTNSKILTIEDMKSEVIQGLIYDSEIVEEDFLSQIESELKFYPIRSNTDFQINKDSFENLKTDDAKKIFDKLRENWILQNNITLVEELFKTRSHLQSLYPNDRASFFEELWFILKSNLGANNLKLLYNDLIKAKNENEKNKLVKVKIIGSRFPEPVSVDEMDEKILKNYEKDFGSFFEITDYNKEKGQLVICATIKKSPVLIMANVYQLTRLQKSVLISLFEGLNS